MDQPKQAETPAAKPDQGKSKERDKPSFWARPPVIVSGTILIACLLAIGLLHLAESFTHESTDDAFLDGDIVSVAPKVAGQVKQVHVSSNQRVKKGDLLVEIDPRDLSVQLEQKRAAQEAAAANVQLMESSLGLLRAQIGTAEATAKQSGAEAAASEASALKAQADFKRAEELIRQSAISSQEFDSARAAATAAEANLRAAREKAASDQSKVAEFRAQLEAGLKAFERARAQAHQAQIDIQQAELNLSYARIVAPEDGQVTRKSVENGDYIQIGQRLLALVLNRMWVTANFKETQLKLIRVGQPVRVTIDSLPGQVFAGYVESIQAGSGARFSLLPPENAVGNYVKVVQRVPVRIFFDGPVQAGHVLGPGMSVVPSVRVKSYRVPELLVWAVAIVVACGLGWVWLWKANRKPAG